MDAQRLRTAVVNIEKIAATYVGNEVEALRNVAGNKLASELLASVACLFCARAVAVIHLWSGEPVENIKARVFETFEHDLKATLKKIATETEKNVQAQKP